MSQQCRNVNDSNQEDWDKSLVSEGSSGNDISTPLNTVVFPVSGSGDAMMPKHNSTEWSRTGSVQSKKTLSELLKRHAEKGTNCRLSQEEATRLGQEEATRLGEVLGQWVCYFRDSRGVQTLIYLH